MGRKAGSPTLYKQATSEVWWCRFTAHKREHRKSTGTRDEEKAREVAQQLYAKKLIAGRQDYVKPKKSDYTTTEKLMVSYCAWAKADGREDSTIHSQMLHFNARFLPRWKFVSEITVPEVEQYKVDRMSTKISSTTLYKELVTLNVFLKWCKRMGHIADVPEFRQVKPVSDYVPPNLSREDALRLLAALPDRYKKRKYPIREYFSVQWSQGLRRGNVWRLIWSDVDLRSGVLTIRPKSEKNKTLRYQPIGEVAYEVLKDMHDECKPLRSSLIFGKRSFETTFKNTAERLGLGNVITHALRHCRLSDLASASRDTAAVQYFAGHKHLSTTDKYVRSRLERAATVVSLADGTDSRIYAEKGVASSEKYAENEAKKTSKALK